MGVFRLEIDEIIRKIKFHVQEIHVNPGSGHGMDHLERTLRLALYLLDREGGDKAIIIAATLLHDLHHYFSTLDETLEKAKEILEQIGFPRDKIEAVLNCISCHECYSFGSKPKKILSLEAKIVQDADMLDAIGAIGIARAFMFGGMHNRPIWEPSVPLRKTYDYRKLEASTIHHFYEKLLRLKDEFNTDTARRIAIGRHKFMEEFVKQLKKEWEGSDFI